MSREEVNSIFEIADNLKEGKEELTLREHSVISLFFQYPSVRTRSAFEAAATQLGSSSIYISGNTSQLESGELPSDIAKALSGYCDFIVARMLKHQDLAKMAEGASVPLINGMTDLEHPTQALSDLYTIRMYKGNLKNVKLAFMGDITSNVANSLMLFGSRLGMEIALVGPKEMIPNSIYFNKSREYGTLDTFASLDEGLEDADIVYTDTFSGMGKSNPDEGRLKSLSQYRLTNEAMQKADPDALVMHCLPVHRGVEVDADVIDGPKSIIWQQAKNKMLLAKAILLYLSKGR
ncbi:MAG: ornithine carbamoyltransferase [Candidatus Marsarchaeota archaeon]|nr:ornithine carbamoyltransferase [Candidatus Marsarchaeota archaeon]MCL5430726.1 ornithine carbamoyltransferase [Candidatus Marsarchaeota archaeon]